MKGPREGQKFTPEDSLGHRKFQNSNRSSLKLQETVFKAGERQLSTRDFTSGLSVNQE